MRRCPSSPRDRLESPLARAKGPAMLRWLWRIVLLATALALLLSLSAWWLLRGSLPALDGESALAGLSAPVQVHRDALGTVTIDARTHTDALRALRSEEHTSELQS